MRPGPLSPCVACSLLGFTIVWVALFWELVLPEIQRASFTPTRCFVLSAEVVPRYGCSTTCESCTETASPNTCGALVAEFQSMSPAACLNGTADQCPEQGSTCGNGFVCCAEVCQSCCSTSCGGKPSTCRTSCVPCYCVCAVSVSNDQCSVSCATLYAAVVRVRYTAVSNATTTTANETTAEIAQDFGANEVGAQAFVSAHATAFTCYYDPEDPSEVELSRAYDVQMWVIFIMVGNVPLLMSAIMATAQLARSFAVGIAVWMGAIVPLGVFLPIAYAGDVDADQQRALTVTACVAVAVFNAPLVWERAHIYFVQYMCLAIAISVGIPVYLYSSKQGGILVWCICIAASIFSGPYPRTVPVAGSPFTSAPAQTPRPPANAAMPPTPVNDEFAERWLEAERGERSGAAVTLDRNYVPSARVVATTGGSKPVVEVSMI